MSEEEIKIIVNQETRGDALEKAAENAAKVEQSASRPQGKWTPPPGFYDGYEKFDRLNREASTAEGKGNQSRQRKADIGLSREIAATTRLEAKERSAAGDHDGAEALEREAAILERSAKIMRDVNVSREKAEEMATKSVEHDEAIAKAAQERATVEKDITKEKKEQARASQAQGRHDTQLGRGMFGRMMGNMGMGGMTRSMPLGGGMGGLFSLLGKFSGITTAITALASVFTTGMNAGDRDRDRETDYRKREAQSGRERKIISGVRGTAGDAREEKHQIEQEIASREENRKKLENAADKWNNPRAMVDRIFGTNFRKKGFLGMGTAEGIAEEDNEVEIARLRKEAKEYENLQKEKFQNEEGGIGLAIDRATAEHSAAGMRERRVLEERLNWLGDYRRRKAQGASEEEAIEGANLSVRESIYQKSIQSAAGMVNARSGSGDVARAAAWAQQSVPDQARLEQEIRSMHANLVKHEGKAIELQSRKKLTKDELKP